MCNEIFNDRSVSEGLTAIARAGYGAVELAPSTLGGRPDEIDAATRARLTREIANAGLAVTGLHWLLADTKDLHVSAADTELRAQTLEYLRDLTRLCADLGGTVLVFGSPAQRSTPPGMSRTEARARAVDLFAAWAVTAAECGMTICLEALPRNETDFLNTTAEVIDVVETIGSSAVGMVLDVKSMCDEEAPIPDLIQSAAPHLVYFQANDANRSGPGFGETDFVPIFRALTSIGYRGDISVEAFEAPTGPDDLAVRSLRYMLAAAETSRFPIS